jgi:GT2 family glycosyltransferase
MIAFSSTVIICTRNRCHDLINCLQSLSNQTVLPTQLVVVDSSTTPLSQNSVYQESCKKIQLSFPNYTYVHTQPGLTHQRNIGIKHASGNIVYFFDDDTVLEHSYLEHMQKLFLNNPHYAGGMGSIINIPERPSSRSLFFKKIFLLQRDYDTGLYTYSGMPTHTYGTNKFKDVEVLGGCCMAYRSWVFEHHLFDESLPGYGAMEDCDFSYRVSQLAPLFFTPQARLYHYNSPLSRDKISENRAMFIAHYSYLFFKNFYPKNKLRIFAYLWSTQGLFIEAILFARNLNYIKGYVKGLYRYFSTKKPRVSI